MNIWASTKRVISSFIGINDDRPLDGLLSKRPKELAYFRERAEFHQMSDGALIAHMIRVYQLYEKNILIEDPKITEQRKRDFLGPLYQEEKE